MAQLFSLDLVAHAMKQKPFAEQIACLTGEFVGGIIAGIGFGIMITNTFMASPAQHVAVPPLLWVCSFFCAAGGSLLARSARLKRRSKKHDDEKHEV